MGVEIDPMGLKKKALRFVRCRKELLFVLVISIIIRIPRVPGILGNDAFIALFMGNILSEGYFVNWTLSPFSMIGLYPFASYPIGIPLMVAIMLRIGLSFEIIVFTISILSGIVGTLGAYYLGDTLFRDRLDQIIFTLFYTLSHVFVTYTYYTLSPRGPFLAILPWFLYYGLKLIRTRQKAIRKPDDNEALYISIPYLKLVFILGSLFVLQFFIHALAIYSILYCVVALGYSTINYIVTNHRFRKIQSYLGNLVLRGRTFSGIGIRGRKVAIRDFLYWFFFLGASGGAFLVGMLILPIDTSEVSPFLNISNSTFIGLCINLIIDYGLKLGVLSMFLPIGIFAAYYSDLRSSRKFVHFLLIPIVLFTLPVSTYSSVIFLPVFAYYSVIGFKKAHQKIGLWWIGMSAGLFCVVFGVAYIQLVIELPLWLTIVIPLIGLGGLIMTLGFARSWISHRAIPGYIPDKYRKVINQGHRNRLDKQGIFVLILSMIIVSHVVTEGLILQSPYKYITSDEQFIIDYLDGQDDPGITFVPTPVIGRHLEAYGFPAVLSFNDNAALYFGWIDPSTIPPECHLNIAGLLSTTRLFTYTGESPERVIFNGVFSLNLTDSDDRESAKEIGLEYIIVEKMDSGFSNVFTSSYGKYYSILLETAPLGCELVLEGDMLALFRLA